jgi:hypothetical protein
MRVLLIITVFAFLAAAASISTSLSDDDTFENIENYTSDEVSSSFKLEAHFLSRCLYDIHIMQSDLSKLSEFVDTSVLPSKVIEGAGIALYNASTLLDRYEGCLPSLVSQLGTTSKEPRIFALHQIHLKTSLLFSAIITAIVTGLMQQKAADLGVYERSFEKIAKNLSICP